MIKKILPSTFLFGLVATPHVYASQENHDTVPFERLLIRSNHQFFLRPCVAAPLQESKTRKTFHSFLHPFDKALLQSFLKPLTPPSILQSLVTQITLQSFLHPPIVESTKKAQEIALAQFLKHRQYDKIFLQCSLVESTQQAQEKSLKEAVIKKQKERERLIAQEKVIDEVLKEQKAKEQLLKEQKAKETEIYEFLEKKMIASSDFEPGNEKISFENFKRKQMILALLDTQTYFFIDKKKVLFKIEQMEYQTYNSLFYAITQNGTKLERVEPIIGIEWVKKNQSKEKKHIDFSTVRRKIYKDIEENKNKPIGIDNLTIKDLFEDPTCPLKDWIDKGTVSGVDLIRFMNFFYKDQGLKQINLFNYNYTIDNFFLNKDKLITNMSEFTLNQAVFKLDQNHTFFKIDKKKIQINNDIFIYTASQPASNNFEHLNIIHEDDL